MTQQPAPAERLPVNEAQTADGPDQPVDGVGERTSHVNPNSSADTRRGRGELGLGGSEQGGMAGAVGYFEGEGNEGPFAPLGGDQSTSAADVAPNHQDGTVSDATDTA